MTLLQEARQDKSRPSQCETVNLQILLSSLSTEHSQKKSVHIYSTMKFAFETLLAVFVLFPSNLNSIAQRCRTEAREKQQRRRSKNSRNVCQEKRWSWRVELSIACKLIYAFDFINFVNNASDTYFNFHNRIFRQFNFPNELSTSRAELCALIRTTQWTSSKVFSECSGVFSHCFMIWKLKMDGNLQHAVGAQFRWSIREQFWMRIEFFSRKTQFSLSKTFLCSLACSPRPVIFHKAL